MPQETEAEFRARVQAFFSAHAPRRRVRPDPDAAEPVAPEAAEGQDEGGHGFLSADDGDMVSRSKAFQAAMFDAGLAGLTWPREYGGQGLTNREIQIWGEESAAYELPASIYTIGHGMCGPTILQLGTEAQKQRYIRPMLRGDEVWCQLFSEPGAGSDVASLQTRAVRDGEEWVVNGQKVWSSGAHYCDWGVVITRTNLDNPKHRGISMFIVDMHSPGVTVRPLRQITGGSNFNEVFFDDVRIPAENLIGEVDEGWRAAVAMLMNERVAIGAGGGGGRASGVSALIRLAQRRDLAGDGRVRQDLADLYVRETILGYIAMRVREAVKSGKTPGPEGSIAKLCSSLLARRLSDVAMVLAGPAGTAWPEGEVGGDRWSLMVLGAPVSAIAGGTDQIQRNIIGERVLGLPKDPQVDRDLPFRQLKVGTQREAV